MLRGASAISQEDWVIHVFKVKWAGKPVETFTGTKLKEKHPTIYTEVRMWEPGTKKRLGKRAIAVHRLHPREMSVKARRKVCGVGLRGEARRLFIEEGMTFTEQCQQGRLIAAAHTNAAVERWKKSHPEEYAVRTRRAKERSEKRREEKGGIDYSKFYSPDQIAKAAKVTPGEVRKFLRKKNVGKRGGRYAFKKHEAQKIVKALRRQVQQKG